LEDFDGVASGSFNAPDHEYPSHLELRLTVTDSGGLNDTESVRLDPQTVVLTFQSSPTGLALTTGSGQGTTPFDRTVIVGSSNSVSAPSPQSSGGTSYRFDSWSDGGPQTHNVIAPASDTTYAASYIADDGPPPNCTITGTPGNDILEGTERPDHICGGGGNDTIRGLGGKDILKGESGNDNLLGGGSDDTYDGGTGGDAADFSGAAVGVVASLADGTATGEGTDTLSNVEKLLGSPNNDTLTGSAAANTLRGVAGSDTIRGLEGNEVMLHGGGGVDTVYGGLGNDRVTGGGAADSLLGEEGDDTVNSQDGINGNDTLDGGPHVNGDTKVSDTTERSIVGFP